MRTWSTFLFWSAAAILPEHRADPPGTPKPAEPPPVEMPTDPLATPDPRLLRECLDLIERRQFREAQRAAERLVEEYPQASQPHLLLALTFHKQRKYAQAEPIFVKARQLGPDNHAVKMYLGWCRYYLGRHRLAKEAFESYLPTHPNYPDVHHALGLVAFENDELDAATTFFAKAIELAQSQRHFLDEAKSRTRLADVMMRRQEFTAARKELEQAVRLNPNLYGAYFKLSRVLYRLGDPTAARAAKRKHDLLRKKLGPTKGHPE